MKISSDDKHIKSLIERCEKRITEAGGFINERLKVRYERGEMTLSLPISVEEGAPLIFVPEAVMPVVEQFNIALVEGGLNATKKTEVELDEGVQPASDLQVEMMSTMMEMYSAAGKIRSYSQFSPQLSFGAYPQLLEVLNRSRTAPLRKAEGQSEEDWVVQVFLGSRAYGGFGDKLDRLMPLIDFADHHVAAPGFTQCPSEEFAGSGVAITAAENGIRPDCQCLVSYGFLDRMEAYLNYGFADRSPGFVRSVPVDVELPDGGLLHIAARPISGTGIGPESFQFSDPKMQFFASKCRFMQESERNAIEIGFALIPDAQHTVYLSQSLAFHLKNYESHFGCDEHSICNPETVRRAENAVIDANTRYYKELLKSAKAANLDSSLPATKMLSQVIKEQMRYITVFTDNIENLRQQA